MDLLLGGLSVNMVINNRLGTVNNLEVGGTYDMLLIKVEGKFPEGKITFGLYDVPMKITGLQKVVQTFLKILFTTRGSDVFYPNLGTRFPSLTVNANITSSDSALLSDIADEITSASEQTRNSLNVNTEDLSSTMDSVEVLGMDKIPEGLIMYLQVRTLAGEFAAVAVPFPEFGLGS
jgi:phage baseplate assembly protein W